jgi:two-component system sensor histidine kinase and response regulator WspE
VTAGGPDDLSGFSLSELFRIEAENQTAVLIEGLLALEADGSDRQWFESLMRAAHSMKGASRIADRESGVQIAHAMEDCFVRAQKDQKGIESERIERLLVGVDLLSAVARVAEADVAQWELDHQAEIATFVESLTAPLVSLPPEPVGLPSGRVAVAVAAAGAAESPAASAPIDDERADVGTAVGRREPEGRSGGEATGRTVRVRADSLNRLLGFAAESMVGSRWLDRFSEAFHGLSLLHERLAESIERLRDASGDPASGPFETQLTTIVEKDLEFAAALRERFLDLDRFTRRTVDLSTRLYEEVLASRMRPFSDGIEGLPRMVRDTARSLGKEVSLEVAGRSTTVDRDILEKLEAPLAHLLRNAVDHGIEDPEERARRGKARQGTIRIEARHSAGMLLIVVSDDGGGIDTEAIRSKIISRALITSEAASKMSEPELLEFLFLPAFTTRDTVSEVSGRGVGLDVVKTMLREVGGIVRIASTVRVGTEFQLQLPLTLSVLRTLVAEIGGEAYAFPLSRIERVLRVPADAIESLEGRQHITVGDQQVGLVVASQLLELEGVAAVHGEDASVIVLGERKERYGLVVDRFLGEKELVIRPLDPLLGKIRDISAAALLEDGSPVLIIDTDDLIRSIENLAAGGRLSQVTRSEALKQKSVLVVDDSLTVRELERKLLDSHGYRVDVAVDGADGWNAARAGTYDLVVTDVDMPRLDGIELVTRIRGDARLKATPVIIVSYKDREEDRQRGLEAGADYYLTKGSFQDDSLLRAVSDLIGEANG